jgi:hypothetical protein
MVKTMNRSTSSAASTVSIVPTKLRIFAKKLRRRNRTELTFAKHRDSLKLERDGGNCYIPREEYPMLKGTQDT